MAPEVAPALFIIAFLRTLANRSKSLLRLSILIGNLLNMPDKQILNYADKEDWESRWSVG